MPAFSHAVFDTDRTMARACRFRSPVQCFKRDKLISEHSHVWTDEGIAWYAYESGGSGGTGPF